LRTNEKRGPGRIITKERHTEGGDHWDTRGQKGTGGNQMEKIKKKNSHVLRYVKNRVRDWGRG